MSGEVEAAAVLTGVPHGTPARPLTPRDPRQLGEYELVGRLGEGGMGRVYLARSGTGRLVAVKVIRDALAEDDDFRRRFRGEVARAAQVPPFCTAEVLDADPDHDPPYLVVEYVDGPSLADVVELNGPLTPANLHGLAVGMAAALTAIHGAGVIHRDLKPSNVLLAPGTPKVIDFGISRPVDGTLTHSSGNHVLGTVAYMSPERFGADASRTLTPAADIFAWGAVVAFAGTGRVPFPADGLAQIAVRIMTDPPELDGLTGSLRDLVEQALAKEPGERPAARDLLDRLTTGGVRATVPPVTVREEPLPRRRRRASTVAGVLAAVVTLVATLGVASGLIPVPHLRGSAVQAETSPSPSPVPSVPAGFRLLLSDPLTAPGNWRPSVDDVHKARCDIDNGLVVTLQQRSTFRCKVPQKLSELSVTDIGVFVDVTLVSRGSCAGIWFRFVGGGYLLQACADGMHLLRHGLPEPTSAVTLYNFGRSSLPLGQATRIGIVAQGDQLRLYRAGAQIATYPLGPDVGAGHVVLGQFTSQAGDPPFQVRFANVEVWMGES
jgi:serine/threonine protein kinase